MAKQKKQEKIYANLTECVHDNLDKKDPKKYCLELLNRTNKQIPPFINKK